MAKEEVILEFKADEQDLKKGAQKVEKAVDKVGDEAKKTEKDIDKAFKGGKGRFGGITKSLGNVAGKLGPVGIAGVATGAVAGIGALVFGAIEGATALGSMSDETGIAVETLSGLEQIAKQNDASFDGLVQGFRKVNKTLGDAKAGMKGAQEGLARIGLEVSDFEGLSSEQVYGKVIDAINGIEDPAERSAAAQKLLGGSAKDAISVFAQGGPTFEEAIARQKELGTVTSEESARAAQELTAKMNEMKGRVAALAANALPHLLSALDAVGKIIGTVSGAVGTFIGWLQKAWEYIDGPVLSVLGAIVDYFQLVWKAIQTWWGIVKPIFELYVAAVKLIWQAIQTWWGISKPIFDLYVDAVKLVGKAIQTWWGIVTGIFEYAKTYFSAVLEVYRGIFQGAWNTLRGIFEAAKTYLTTVFGIYRVIFDTALNAIVGIFTKYWGAVQGVFNAIAGFVEGVFSGVSSIVGRVIDGWLTAFRGLRDGIKAIINTVLGLWEGLVNGIIGAINTILNAWNSLEFTLPSVTVFGKKIGGFTIGTPNIPTLSDRRLPRLAKGGIVTAPTVALIGEAGPEAVVPLNQYNQGGAMRVVVELKLAPGVEELITAKVNRVNNRTSREDPSYITDLGQL